MLGDKTAEKQVCRRGGHKEKSRNLSLFGYSCAEPSPCTVQTKPTTPSWASKAQRQVLFAFTLYLLSTFCVPSTVLEPGDTPGSKTRQSPWSLSIITILCHLAILTHPT